ncbi:DUF2254 domain-containing protein [Solirubrobacter ginsenosidimutans]|uniref:DUF2254 domain-containing protein n=1 Tax=Solirubrobacter ginsenosidimutans TaxID=490573 RepID=A0A9X3MSL1_9ACTN|nr:DUF2254 domain-containing protein [Solirubrobacter ginsenosidimutans]MDA0160415.1 DUF2254 domain-containing protein [Solirubrobacter ginsenosidimutans]
MVPLVCAVAGPLLAELTVALETHIDIPNGWMYSESTASAVLAAIVGAMVGLTGFVVAFGVLIVQMATQTLSPRFMRLWFRDGLQKTVLGTFVGTLTFALALLRRVGPDTVPDIGVTIAGIAVTVSVVLFLVYLDRFIHRLRPVAVGWIVARAGARVFQEMQPTGPHSELGDARPEGPPSLEVHSGAAGAIQAIDRRGLLETATRHDCVLELAHAVGDIVPHGSVLLRVFGATPPDAEHLRGLLAIGEERTIEQDPAFALRILVDIAIRALSPAVNDPTTACQILGAIEDLLLVIGESDLRDRDTICDGSGRPRVLIVTRRWDDLLALALTEIRDYGATSTQTTRRLAALLDHLAARVRPEHRAAVEEQVAELAAALERFVPDPRARAFASRPDAQGIGGASSAEVTFSSS